MQCNEEAEAGRTHNDAGGLLPRLHRALELEPLLRQHVDLGRVVWRRGRAHRAVKCKRCRCAVGRDWREITLCAAG